MRTGTARTGRRGTDWTHALADAQVVACEADLKGAGPAAPAVKGRKKSTVVVTPPVERPHEKGKRRLQFAITVKGTRKQFYTDFRPLGVPLAPDRDAVSDFIGWFSAGNLSEDRKWPALAGAEWTRRKLARMEGEPAPIRPDKYAARSHPRALVRVPGGAAPRSRSGWSRESACSAACGAGSDRSGLGRPVAARALEAEGVDRAVAM